MTIEPLQSAECIDNHFGKFSAIRFDTTLMNETACNFFGCAVDIDVVEHTDFDNKIRCNGFIKLLNQRIPFEFVQDKNSIKNFSMHIILYYTVVYSRNSQFEYDDYHLINTPVKNVEREHVETYTDLLLTNLPEVHKKQLSGVLDSLYFYPYIDGKNGKSLKVIIDMCKNKGSYFINHYQQTSDKFFNNMKFYCDDDAFSLTTQDYTYISIKDLEFKDYWGALMSAHFRNKVISELLVNDYKTMDEVLFSVSQALKVVEMNEI